MSGRLTRRQFLGGSLALPLLGSGARLGGRPARAQSGGALGDAYQLYWGDLHNHNAVGYAKGSLERSIEIAQQHLDVFAFTGQAHWHDMPKMPNDKHMHWVNGFKAHEEHWPKTRRLIEEANSASDFTAFLGYEWHSSQFGDYCMIFPEDQPDLYLPDHVEKLLDFAEQKGAYAITHHVNYKQGMRGANFAHLRPDTVCPVVEIMSEHGCSERVRAPYDYIRHSMGGRASHNTIQRQLEKGMRFGFVASSDDHRGYPGAYKEGIVGIWAPDQSRGSIFEALRKRRTYAVTGDRIVLDVALNGEPMGSELKPVRDRQIDVQIEGEDAIWMVELVRNGKVIDRYFPEDDVTGPPELPGRVKGRLRYGWGPWAALELGRICSWDIRVQLAGARFLSHQPYFQSAPFDEALRDKQRLVSETELHINAHTTRINAYMEDPTKESAFEIEGGPEAKVMVELKKPVEQQVEARLKDLVQDNVVTFTEGYPHESYILEQVVGPAEYSVGIRWEDERDPSDGPDWYYVRVTQHNNQYAWSSPIWVG